MVRLLHRASRRRDSASNHLFRDLLGHLVLANGTAIRELCLRLRLPDGHALLPLPSKLGSVDLRIRPILHSHLERAAVLLRDVLALQRRGETILHASSFLAVLDVLCESIYILVCFRHLPLRIRTC